MNERERETPYTNGNSGVLARQIEWMQKKDTTCVKLKQKKIEPNLNQNKQNKNKTLVVCNIFVVVVVPFVHLHHQQHR